MLTRVWCFVSVLMRIFSYVSVFVYFCRCKRAFYPRDLPQISIIFIFVNEALSVILRSVHSAVNHTPSHLLKEIILVDDNSDDGEISNYISNNNITSRLENRLKVETRSKEICKLMFCVLQRECQNIYLRIACQVASFSDVVHACLLYQSVCSSFQ